MANTKASKKDIRKSARRTERNRVVKTRLKTLRKNALLADAPSAETVSEYASALDKAAKRGIIHPNRVNRQKAAMARKAKAAVAAPSAEG